MSKVVDFYEYKYCKSKYFINVFISKESAQGINVLLTKKLKEKNLNKESICVYKILKEKIDNNKHRDYTKLRINKCYLKYIKDLYYDYYYKKESKYIKEVICHLLYFI